MPGRSSACGAAAPAVELSTATSPMENVRRRCILVINLGVLLATILEHSSACGADSGGNARMAVQAVARAHARRQTLFFAGVAFVLVALVAVGFSRSFYLRSAI